MATVTRYAEKADIVAIYNQETLDLIVPKIGQPPVEDDTTINRGLDEASRLIDSYIAAIVPLPFDGSIPATLRRPCVDIALYFLAINPMARTAEQRTRYEDAIKWLEKVAAGKATLGPYDLDGDGVDDEDAEEVPKRKTGLFSVGVKRG